MLRTDERWRYWVWPSWATAFSFQWGDLPRLLADPVKNGCLDINEMNHLRQGFLVNDAGEVHFHAGAFGNGIIAFRQPTKHTWIGGCVFNKEASIMGALGMTTSPTYRNVAFLELRGDAGLRLGLAGLKKPTEYPCSISIEHVDAAGDDVYWLLDRQLTSKPLSGIESVTKSAESFGLTCERVPAEDVSKPLQDECSEWFTDGARMEWFRIGSAPPEASLNLAMMYYAALHLKSIAKGRMRCMHLVGNVEGKPRNRIRWGRR